MYSCSTQLPNLKSTSFQKKLVGHNLNIWYTPLSYCSKSVPALNMLLSYQYNATLCVKTG